MRERIGVLVIVAAVQLLLAAGASASGPTPHGALTLSGTLRDGSTLTATGLSWTPVAGSVQSISYSWAACTAASGCTPVSTAVDQPYLASITLGPGDVGKHIRVQETATDLLPDGTASAGTKVFQTSIAVIAWPAAAAPRVDFVYGLPGSRTASVRERFDLSAAHANRADGPVVIACALDGGAYSTACAASHSYLTPVLSLGTHTMHVRARNSAGASTTTFTWTVVALPVPVRCSSCFAPPHLDATGHPMSWDWQLQGRLVFRTVDMFDIDGFGNAASVVQKIHARVGRTLPQERAICYLSLGSWENFRPDASRWPAGAIGLPLSGYPDEHWVDVRQLSALMPVISTRMQMCASKHFDGVEVDNIDVWNNPSGFPLTPQDAQAWLAAIANLAHSLHMFVLWKNEPYLASFGKRYFDGALSEQCYSFEECTAAQNDGTTFFPGLTCDTTSNPCGVAQFAAAGKWVGEVEYKWGVVNENGAVCDPAQSCTLQSGGGALTEVPYLTFCKSVYQPAPGGYGFSAWRPYESDALDGTHSFYCWGP